MLEIKDLSVSYGHITALENVSFNVPDGELISIIGANGAGKSTLLNAISGQVKIKSGGIMLDGLRLSSLPHKIVRKGIIQVPEGRKIFAGLTVTENLIIGGNLQKRSELKKRINEMYETFPILKERKSQLAGTFSGGEQQMLAIARGLMANPRIILFDEPSLGLAPIIVKQVFELILKIKSMGITILLVEQNALQALSICDYAYVLENGKIVISGKKENLLNDTKVKSAYLGENSI